MTISITENAAKQIQKQLDKRGSGLGLRLGVKKSGCSGYSYVLDYADELQSDDHVFENFDVKIVVKDSDLTMLDGISVDYKKEGLSAAFKFDNPNARGTCGCGESFAVKQ